MKPLSGLILCLLFFHSYGQYPYPKQAFAERVKDRTLAVQLLPEETEVESALNAVLIEAFDENWELTAVEYFSPKAFAALKKSSRDRYAFLEQRTELNESLRLDMDYIDGSLHGRILGTSNSATQTFKDELKAYQVDEVPFDYYDFVLNVFDGKKEKFVTTVSFINDDLGKHDYLFLCQQIQLLLTYSAQGYSARNYQDTELNMNALSQSTTYFLDDFHEQDVLDHFDKYYAYPYRVVAYADYVDLILSKKEGAAYLKMIFAMQQNKYMWGLVDAATGRVLSLNECGDYKFSGSFDADKIVKPAYLKSATDINAQMLNNYYAK
jgi:hypothetical protein